MRRRRREEIGRREIKTRGVVEIVGHGQRGAGAEAATGVEAEAKMRDIEVIVERAGEARAA